tara:strand:- start:3452 stop:4681 length:1230 start_codon:yes stop_codon:yes gene_type:complete
MSDSIKKYKENQEIHNENLKNGFNDIEVEDILVKSNIKDAFPAPHSPCQGHHYDGLKQEGIDAVDKALAYKRAVPVKDVSRNVTSELDQYDKAKAEMFDKFKNNPPVRSVYDGLMDQHFFDAKKGLSFGTKINSDTTKDTKDGGGLRYNTGKLRYDLQHPIATEGLVKVLTKGAAKYAPRNWERGMKWSDVIQSLKRHLAAIESGEDYDSETGELHINHLQCNAHFLSAYYKIFPQGDDRAHSYLEHPKIGLDIDEVLADWIGAWRKLNGITEEPTSWYFDRNLMDTFESMRKEGILDDFYLGLKPLIKPLDIPFEPHCYITSRPVDTKITEKWLDMHGFPARPVFTTTAERTKVVIAKEQGLDMFVDDSFSNFKPMNLAGICTFLMDRPHNHRYNVGFKRIKNLKEIL